METISKPLITVETTVAAPVEKVWQYWTTPEHVMQWNFAADDWHSPAAINDLRPGGKFSFRMEAKDGSVGFDFWGIYDTVKENECLEFTLGDNRKVTVYFSPVGQGTKVVESFEAETTHSEDMQRTGWQMILDNFKRYTQSS